jgi:hypothetical protein
MGNFGGLSGKKDVFVLEFQVRLLFQEHLLINMSKETDTYAFFMCTSAT